MMPASSSLDAEAQAAQAPPAALPELRNAAGGQARWPRAASSPTRA